jgi:hypothetical protein
MQKTLEDANTKLDSVISDVLGLSGRRMIEALIAGESDPEALAVLAHRAARSLVQRQGPATSYAQLMHDQGPVSEAQKLLAPVYGWFSEGFDTRDLKDAKALLDELTDAPAFSASRGFEAAGTGADRG